MLNRSEQFYDRQTLFVDGLEVLLAYPVRVYARLDAAAIRSTAVQSIRADFSPWISPARDADQPAAGCLPRRLAATDRATS